MLFKNKLIQIFVALFSKKKTVSSEKCFLILSTTGLGDTLWATPSIAALKTCFPRSTLCVLTSSIGKALLQHNPHIDEIFVVKNPVYRSFFSLYRKLKLKKFTHILNFHTSQRSILPFAAILGAQEIIGTEKINKGLDFLLTQPLPAKNIHEIQRRLNIVSKVGAETLNFSMELFLSPEDERLAEQFLSSWEIASHTPLIALHPGAKDLFKQWPPSHFIELGKRLTRQLGCRIIVSGTPTEKTLVDSIVSEIPDAIQATHLPILAMAALLKKMQLMICNDTGPMHLCFALRTPTIALFTPTDPNLCGPYFIDSTQILSRKTTCTPCLRKKCAEPFCLLQIGVDEVFDAAIKQLYTCRS